VDLVERVLGHDLAEAAVAVLDRVGKGFHFPE
jgi:hypothetical protein